MKYLFVILKSNSNVNKFRALQYAMRRVYTHTNCVKVYKFKFYYDKLQVKTFKSMTPYKTKNKNKF